MRPILTCLLALPLLTPHPRGQDVPLDAIPPRVHFGERHTRGIFFAVLEGLYEDGVSNEVVDAMIAVDAQTRYPTNFVWACPICMPAFDALQLYRSRPHFAGKKSRADTFGSGLPEPLRLRILGGYAPDRRDAIQELVQTWIQRFLDRGRLEEHELTDWRLALEEGRKIGMGYLQSYRDLGGSYAEMQACPFCDAGVAAAEGR